MRGNKTKEEMEYCDFCQIKTDAMHWILTKQKYVTKNGEKECLTRRCKIYRDENNKKNSDKIYSDASLLARKKENYALWERNNPYNKKYSAYKQTDRKKGYSGMLSFQEYLKLVETGCFYCHYQGVIGIDRKDNTIGHALENVVPCCEKCNYLLGDIPFDAKLILKDGLLIIGENQLMQNWTIPTKRKSITPLQNSRS